MRFWGLLLVLLPLLTAPQAVDAQQRDKARKQKSKAARQNYGSALNNIGNCYKQGLGVEQNRAKALEIYNKLAQEGNAEAKDRLERIKNNDFDWELGEAAAADIE